MVTTLAEALAGRRIHVAADAVYAGAELKKSCQDRSSGPPGCARTPPCKALL
jgi:hypothetical protein